MRALGDYLNVKCHACVGGTSVREDTRILQVGRRRPVAASVGRLRGAEGWAVGAPPWGGWGG